MVGSIVKIDPNCDLFNWECSESYRQQKFTEGEEEVFTFIEMMLRRNHILMFSEYSLKALIGRWNS